MTKVHEVTNTRERPRAGVAVTAPNGSGHDRQRPLRTEPIVHGATEEQAQ
jgi:hypothetical protein